LSAIKVSEKNTLIRRWENEAVVYNRCSGDTHLLDIDTADFLIYFLSKTSEERTEILDLDRQNKQDQSHLQLQVLLKLKLIR